MKIIVSITGASGSIYAKNLIDTLFIEQSRYPQSDIKLFFIYTQTAEKIWCDEMGQEIKSYLTEKGEILDNSNFYTPFASGSNCADAMIIVPASMGIVGRIASGISSDLICRVADVQLKEGKRLVVVPRESPFNLIHIKNLTTLCEAGAIIAPPSIPFYNHPKTIDEAITGFSKRVIDKIGLHLIEERDKWMGNI